MSSSSSSELVSVGNRVKSIESVLPTRQELRVTLTRVILPHNSIETISPVLFDAWALEHLNLAHNKIKEITPEISKLKRLYSRRFFLVFINTRASPNRLKKLNLSFNKIEKLPHSFGNLLELTYLDITWNRLEEDSFEPSFFELRNLQSLYLSDNLLAKIGPRFGNLKSLRVLALRDNSIDYISGSALEGLKLLNELHLQGMGNGELTKFVPFSIPYLLFRELFVFPSSGAVRASGTLRRRTEVGRQSLDLAHFGPDRPRDRPRPQVHRRQHLQGRLQEKRKFRGLNPQPSSKLTQTFSSQTEHTV